MTEIENRNGKSQFDKRQVPRFPDFARDDKFSGAPRAWALLRLAMKVGEAQELEELEAR
jgi:hypothetical protein